MCVCVCACVCVHVCLITLDYIQDERDSLQRRKETLEQDSESMMAKIAGFEEQLTVERAKLQETQVCTWACVCVHFLT